MIWLHQYKKYFVSVYFLLLILSFASCDRQNGSQISEEAYVPWEKLIGPHVDISEVELRKWYSGATIIPYGNVPSEVLLSIVNEELTAYNCDRYLLSDDLVSALKSAKQIKMLRMRGWKHGVEINWIANLNQLQILDLEHSVRGDTQTLEWLADLTDLKSLTVGVIHSGEMPIARKYWLPLSRELVYLRLSYADLTTSHMEFLDVYPNLIGMDIGGTNITDEGIRELSRIAPNLEQLRLVGNRGVTSRSIEYLGNLKKLRWVHLGSTTLKRTHFKPNINGVPELQRLLPNCEFEYGT